MVINTTHQKGFSSSLFIYLGICVGSFLAAFAIRVFLFPNHIIDGGIVGLSLILGRLINDRLVSLYLICINLPFVYLAYRYIRSRFVFNMLIAVCLFSLFLGALDFVPTFQGDTLEIIIIGGTLLGFGVGLIIRNGGCLDGSEILGILISKRFGFTIGQVILVFNLFVFTLYGIIFLDWHSAFLSLLTFIVAFKMIDFVIVGLEEIKSVIIISDQSKKIAEAIVQQLGLGLTITEGRGGFTGIKKEILTVLVDRFGLSELKNVVLSVDKHAFIFIYNIHEVVFSNRSPKKPYQKRKRLKA